MNTNIGLCAIAALSLALSLSLSAKEAQQDIYISDNELERVSVKWIEPKSFTDVREPNFSSEKFRRHVFSQLEKHLDKLAKDLPEGQLLSVSVSDVDLAGRIEPASFVGLSRSMEDIRILRNVDIPRIEFAYELLDENGNVLRSEEVSLKNMGYLHGSGISSRNKPFVHEKKMLSKWFAKNIIDEKA
ncbi:MAG: hypothetical protein ACJAVV_001506 [Alphaproteobacteria bacterium]|jgi:hypothetical protein